MAKEKNLTSVTSVAAADFARVVTSAGASVKATLANVAKYIIETYNGSTVAGSAQSVKSALDSLNSNHAVISKVFRDATNKTTRILTVKNNARYIVCVESSNTARCGLFLVMSYASGTVFVMDIYKGSGLSYTTATNKITFTTTSEGAADYCILSVDGSAVSETLS